MRDTSRYRVGGVRVPSVTEVLQIAGAVDLSAIPGDVLEAARARGHQLHEWLELLDAGLIGDADEPDDEIAPYVGAYKTFRAQSDFTPTEIEKPVVSETYRYAGTIDRLGILNGRRVVLDLKTGVESPATGLQLAGYDLALTHRHARFALYLHRDGTFKLNSFRGREDTHDWLACLRVAHYKLRHGLARLED